MKMSNHKRPTYLALHGLHKNTYLHMKEASHMHFAPYKFPTSFQNPKQGPPNKVDGSFPIILK